MAQEHSPTPWYEPSPDLDVAVAFRRAYEIRAVKGTLVAYAQSPDDARFIKRACNSHDSLLAALEGLMPHFDKPTYDDALDIPCGEDWAPVDEARKAIQEAKP